MADDETGNVRVAGEVDVTGDVRERAERRLEEALSTAGARDPRDHYRELLKELRQESRDGYDEAVRHYEEDLLPAVAEGEAEPVAAWRELGRRIAELTAPGRTVAVDATGASRAYDPEGAGDELVLHLPDEKRRRALLVTLPAKPSEAQKAAYRLLVAGRKTL